MGGDEFLRPDTTFTGSGFREAAATSDTAKRVELYQAAQKIVLKDSVYAYLYQKSYTLPMRDSVKGYVFNPMLEQVFNLGSMSK